MAIRKEETDKQQLTTAMLLGAAAILNAWIGYKAAVLSGSASTSNSQAGRFHREALEVNNRIGQQTIIDRNAFDRWTAADHARSSLASTIKKRFSPHLQRSFLEWEGSGKPLETTPLDLASYSEPSEEESTLEQKASEATERAERFSTTQNDFVMLQIATATSLFFLGLSSLSKLGRLRIAYVGIGGVILVAAAIVGTIWSTRN